VHGFGTTGAGQHYLAMELLEGQSLSERLEVGSPMSAEELLTHIAVVLTGLDEIHAAGVVHRDLKPDNVFITREGQAKLIDFGVSKTAGAAQLTSTGEVLGTPVFMAPEQADSAKSAMPAADIYAMGAILYDALAGRPPFESKSLAMLLMAIAFEDPPPVTRARPEVPAALAELVARCMSKSPTARPGSATELRLELESLLDAHRDELRHLALSRTES
jgi:serine/threonine protein kinase